MSTLKSIGLFAGRLVVWMLGLWWLGTVYAALPALVLALVIDNNLALNLFSDEVRAQVYALLSSNEPEPAAPRRRRRRRDRAQPERPSEPPEPGPDPAPCGPLPPYEVRPEGDEKHDAPPLELRELHLN